MRPLAISIGLLRISSAAHTEFVEQKTNAASSSLSNSHLPSHDPLTCVRIGVDMTFLPHVEAAQKVHVHVATIAACGTLGEYTATNLQLLDTATT